MKKISTKEINCFQSSKSAPFVIDPIEEENEEMLPFSGMLVVKSPEARMDSTP